ncbi:MAG: hypothetical protein GC184_04030 [Rhizobiales bacterium]|nr:hypothetical protein [Hyphomicrobiales bacterium]
MSIKERITGFSPAGAVAWPLDHLPSWRGGGSTGWWDATAVWDFDPLNNRYMAGAAEVPLAGLIEAQRDTPHLLSNADGAFQAFAPDSLARFTGKGAYIGGAVASLVANGHDVTQSNWSGTGGGLASAGVTILNLMKPAYLASAGSPNTRRYAPTAVLLAGETYTAQFFYRAGTSPWARMYLGSSFIGGAVGALSPGGTANGVFSHVVNTLLPDGVTHRVSANFIPEATGALTLGFGPGSGVPGETVLMCGCDLTQTSYAPPFISAGSPAPSRSASDVTSVSMDWFSSLGGIGASELVVPNWSHTGDGVDRPLFDYVADANNFICGYVTASGYLALKIVTDGVMQTDTALSSAIEAGRGALIFGWSAEGGYVGDHLGHVTSFGAVSLPDGITSKRIGSSPGGPYLNDVIERMTSYRLRTQAQAMALVSAA